MARTSESEGLKSMFLGLVASLERDAENNKKEVGTERPDLSLLFGNQLTEVDEQMILRQDDKKCCSAARLISERHGRSERMRP